MVFGCRSLSGRAGSTVNIVCKRIYCVCGNCACMSGWSLMLVCFSVWICVLLILSGGRIIIDYNSSVRSLCIILSYVVCVLCCSMLCSVLLCECEHMCLSDNTQPLWHLSC